MAIIKCEACSGEISKAAEKCPKCGHPNKKANELSADKIIGGIIVIGLMYWFFAGGGLEKQAQKEMDKIENQVAADAVNQYNIAKNQGDKIQICVQAGFVSAAYLQAQDETNYQTWKAIEKSDCRRAGIQQQ